MERCLNIKWTFGAMLLFVMLLQSVRTLEERLRLWGTELTDPIPFTLAFYLSVSVERVAVFIALFACYAEVLGRISESFDVWIR